MKKKLNEIERERKLFWLFVIVISSIIVAITIILVIGENEPEDCLVPESSYNVIVVDSAAGIFLFKNGNLYL